MATKRDVLKVMEMDKDAILCKIGNMVSPKSVRDAMYEKIEEAAKKVGILPKIVSFSYTIYDNDFAKYITDEKLREELQVVADKKLEFEQKRNAMKRKVNAEFKMLEREILLKGAGEVAEMLAKVVESLTEEVNNGL